MHISVINTKMSTDNNTNIITVWTDGGCLKNGKKGAIAGVGVFFGDNDIRNISEKLPGVVQTNQRSEIQAIVRALEILHNNKNKIEIVSDSLYSIKCITVWSKSWIKNGWLTASKSPVKNKDLLERAIELTKELNVSFKHVNSHKLPPFDTASRDYMIWHGNDRADFLASKALC